MVKGHSSSRVKKVLDEVETALLYPVVSMDSMVITERKLKLIQTTACFNAAPDITYKKFSVLSFNFT